MLLPTMGPSSLPVVLSKIINSNSLWWPSLTKDMQTEQLLCWSGNTDTDHLIQTSASNEEVGNQIIGKSHRGHKSLIR